MTQEQIIDFNKKCAEFLNLHRNEDVAIYKLMAYTYDSLKFHSDWNWIMEVVEAIEKLKYLVVIQSNFCQIQEKGKEDNSFKPLLIACLYSNSKKEAVVQAINQFLIWYEKNK